MPKIEHREKTTVIPKGYIDNDRMAFICTNYDECVSAGLLQYKEVKTPEQRTLEYRNTQQKFLDFKPDFCKDKEKLSTDKNLTS